MEPGQTATGWLVRIAVRDEDREVVASQLWDAGTDGVVVGDGELVAGFHDRAEAESAVAALERWAASVGVAVRITAAESVAWPGATEPHTVPIVGPDGATVTLRVVAGPAFGHGGHTTTVQALDLLTSAVVPGRAVLDVGTGSGVLAIAAAALGAAPVVAIDIDPATIPVARANARCNRVTIDVSTTPAGAARARLASLAPLDPSGDGPGDRVDAEAPGGGSTAPRFEVIVANVLIPTHRQLAPALMAALAPGGSLITAGHLIDDDDEVVDRYRRAGAVRSVPLRVADRRHDEPWSAFRFTADP